MTEPAAAKRVTSKQVACRTCGAQPGEACRGSAYSGRAERSVQSHQLRVRAAQQASAAARAASAASGNDLAAEVAQVARAGWVRDPDDRGEADPGDG